MTTTDVRSPDAETVVAAARSAVPVLREHAERAERDRRIPAESVAALRNAGAFALATPARFGGLDADMVTLARVLSELGRGCPSSAWLAAVTVDAERHFSAVMPEDVLAEFYADPDVRLCGAGMPPGRARQEPGGVRLSGRWPYASGCEDAPWALVTAVVTDGDATVGFAPLLLPTAELGIDRTWHTAGLRATGSHTLVADEVFVPQSHVLALPAGPDGSPDFSVGRPAIFLAGGLTLLSPMVGAARGALDVVGAVLGERRPPGTAYESLDASPGARHLFAEATHLVDSAQRGLLSVAERLDALLPGHTTSPTDRSAMRMELVTITQQCRQAVDKLLDLHGSSSFALANPLQRFWRDLNVGTRHAQFTSYIAVETHGTLLTDTGAPMTVV